MRKYKVKAIARIMDFEDDKPVTKEEWEVSKIIVADDGWDACDKFEESFDVMECDELDDIRFEDVGAADVFITSKRTEYIPDMCNTITVKELIKRLEEFDPESKIYTVDFGTGFGPSVYGPIDYDSVWEVTSEEEE